MLALLYRRLSVSGEWKRRPQQSFFGTDYSEGMEEAVRRFQENQGLRVTGRVDRQTLQALNVPAIARLAQLRINLQRLRDLVAMKHDDRYTWSMPPPSSSKPSSAAKWICATVSLSARPSGRRPR